ncbi:ABC transporter ATP-binding protein [Anaerocolumna chitinilytica]|uniref:ABC transporter ATP-binding protein n=1 Tax=Anaerocolumna chitinilytica TaxID=1727145 RepID=A0A7I8DU58_9FIRM|nr:ABC transporter ATP-binding protein [Anaerocolumna chitinilytica]
MLENVLKVENLYKSIGKRPIIKGISFSVKEGEIFGFLGPNGSGKTTTIKMMVDLIKMDAGSISIMGCDIKERREKALEYVGAVVESPELYSYLTGYENLAQIARIRRISTKKIEEVVELVGLTGRIHDKMKKYSLGMKQRLGLAAALLPDPKLLILDEPTNGLDPNGMIELRNILKRLAREYGMAVFVSSHILGEIQQLCDTVAFIENGVITTVESMTAVHETYIYVLEIEKSEETLVKLKKIEGIDNIREADNGYTLELKDRKSSEVLRDIVMAGIEVQTFSRHLKELEERYMELIKGGIR